MEKRLKLVLGSQSQAFTFYFLFMLLLAEVDAVSQKGGCKRNLKWCGGSAGGKVVFTLLAKVVIFHVGPIAVNISSFGLEFISKSTFWGLEKCLEEVIYIFLRVPGKVKSLRNRKWSLKESSKSFRGSRFVWP